MVKDFLKISKIGNNMINFKEHETVENEVQEEYDYMNEKPLEDAKEEFEYEEDETDYCD